MLNFSELQTSVAEKIERPDSAFVPKIKNFLNERYRHIVSLRPWIALLRQISVPTTAARDYIITPQEVAEIIDIHQRETPIVLALQRYYALLHRNIDGMTTSDHPVKAVPMGEVGIKEPLPSAGTITVESSSASDTTQKIRIRGYDTDKLPVTEVLTLTGTTPVTSAKSYTSTEGYEPRFSKDLDTIGHITVKRDTTVICQLAMDEREARYKKWKLWPVPKSAISLYVTFKKRTYKLEQDEDTPEIECDNALILGAYAAALQEKRQMAKAREVWGQVDANGFYPPGTYMAEVETLISAEPQFKEGFEDQFFPVIARDPIDQGPGFGGLQLTGDNS